MASYKAEVCACLSEVRWTPYREIAIHFHSHSALAAMLGQMVKQREIWCSYFVSLDGNGLHMVAHYCLAHEVGDPPIGRRVRPVMMGMHA
ncbi:MAG: hypothetical protein EPN91_05485 [Salinibacterium sp.]|nr:MAG: hypothetical protein EPN91_05485 [Salinibacterium sp.]